MDNELMHQLIDVLTKNNNLKEKHNQLMQRLIDHQTDSKPRTGFDVDKEEFTLVSPQRCGDGNKNVLMVDEQVTEYTSVTGYFKGISANASVYKDSSVGSGRYEMLFLDLGTDNNLLPIKLKVGRSDRPATHTKVILLALLDGIKIGQLVRLDFEPADKKATVTLCSVTVDGQAIYSKFPDKHLDVADKATREREQAKIWSSIWDQVIQKYDVEVVEKIKISKEDQAHYQAEVQVAVTKPQPQPQPSVTQPQPGQSLTPEDAFKGSIIKTVRTQLGISSERAQKLMNDIAPNPTNSKTQLGDLTIAQAEEVATRLLWDWYYHNAPKAKQDHNQAYRELLKHIQYYKAFLNGQPLDKVWGAMPEYLMQTLENERLTTDRTN
jgi:hypothetical protein